MSILRTIRSYILWTYERGSMQYDVMVTLILVFVFLAPYGVNFKDKPVERTPHQTGVVVSPDGQNGFLYQIDASAVSGKDDATIREDLVRIIEPISGEVDIAGYEPVRDASGKVTAYRVRVSR
jgi:hypothetical protein